MVCAGGCDEPRERYLGAQTPAASAPAVLRVLTWNIQKCEGGVERVIEVIRGARADVILLQEAIEPRDRGAGPASREIVGTASAAFAPVVNQTELISSALRMHAVSSCGELDPAREQCIAIVARTQPVEPRFLAISPARDYAISAVVDTHRGPLRFVCVHLAGTWQVDLSHVLRTSAEREREFADLVSRVDTWSEPLVIAGDFNPVGGANLARLAQRMRRVSGIGPTFPSGQPAFEFDLCFHSNSLRVVRAAALESTVSDHRPVVIEFE